jgi:hypothetical protein
VTNPIDVEVRILERQLDVLDPSGGPYGRKLGVEMPSHTDFADPDVWREEFLGRRRDWLEARYEEMSARAARRQRATAARERGLDRFTGPGRRTLNELLRAAA